MIGRNLLLFTFVAVLSPASTFACQIDDIVISNDWVRPTSGDARATALYMDITNNCDKDQFLTLVQSDITNNIQLHKSVVENDVVKMFHIDKIVIPAKTTVNLKPKSTHIMVMDLAKPIKNGDNIKFMLNFEKLGDKIIDVKSKNK